MQIRDHRLYYDDGTPYPFCHSPNVGGKVQHKYLVIHFTAGGSAEESVKWLANEKAKASAHVVVGRNGSVTQLVPFDTVAWHAGASSWEGVHGLNNHSIGIELDNAGRLTCKGNHWRSWFGTCYDSSDVIQAKHKHESETCGWLDYTAEQIDAALRVASLLVAEYNLIDVVGHEDIAPHRKCDPGPAFPMGNFRSRLLGRQEDTTPLFTATTLLNIRSGPGVEFPTLSGGPLKAGTTVQLLNMQGVWWQVEVQPGPVVPNSFEGWVSSKYLQRVVPVP